MTTRTEKKMSQTDDLNILIENILHDTLGGKKLAKDEVILRDIFIGSELNRLRNGINDNLPGTLEEKLPLLKQLVNIKDEVILREIFLNSEKESKDWIDVLKNYDSDDGENEVRANTNYLITKRIKKINENGKKYPFSYSPFLARKIPSLESVEDQRAIMGGIILASSLAALFTLKKGYLLAKLIQKPTVERFRLTGLKESQWSTNVAHSKLHQIKRNGVIGASAVAYWGINGVSKWAEDFKFERGNFEPRPNNPFLE